MFGKTEKNKNMQFTFLCRTDSAELIYNLLKSHRIHKQSLIF